MNPLNVLLSLWQLPQNIIGIILWIITKHNKMNGYYQWVKSHGGSISLGDFVFVSPYADTDTIKHEQGHQIQSRMLGPLYLFIIGMPSICWAGLRRFGFFKDISYYDFYTEKWANRLAGLDR